MVYCDINQQKVIKGTKLRFQKEDKQDQTETAVHS